MMNGRGWFGAAGMMAILLASCGENPAVDKPIAKTGPALATLERDTAQPSSGSPVAAAADGETELAAPVERGAVAQSGGTPTLAFTDVNGSTIGFVGSKKIGGAHNGGFKKFTGTVSLIAPSEQVAVAAVTAEIDAGSIWSDDEKLTAHLKNKDFFEVETYPTAKFETTSIAEGGTNGASHTLTGNLTLHGVTRSITIPAKVVISDGEVSIKSEFVLDKAEFGMTFSGPGGIIRDEVVVTLHVKATRAS